MNKPLEIINGMNSRKVELAAIKPAQALVSLKKIDDELRSMENTINSAQQKFLQALKSAEAKVDAIDSDLSFTIADAKQLGITDYNQIPDMGDSIKLIQRLSQVINGMRKMYGGQ